MIMLPDEQPEGALGNSPGDRHQSHHHDTSVRTCHGHSPVYSASSPSHNNSMPPLLVSSLATSSGLLGQGQEEAAGKEHDCSPCIQVPVQGMLNAIEGSCC